MAMRVSVDKLRRWLLVGAVALALVLAGFVGYARYRARHFLQQLPGKLGVDIKSETNGFTYSQSIKGKTVFTLHAAKAVQRQNGKTTLHDVWIELYEREHGKDEVSRTDRISGAEFEYDQPAGIVRAAGQVHIDLQTPAGSSAHESDNENDGRIHMQTSGLVFDQKQGVASTDQPIDFHLNDVQGDAVGAEFNADTGVLVLRRDVHLRREDNGKIARLDASAAEVRRNDHVARLTNATYSAGDRTLRATTLFVDLDASGAPTQMRAETVAIIDRDGATIHAPRGVAAIGADHRIHDMRLMDGVRFASANANGASREAHVSFDTQGVAHAAEFNGGVHFRETAGTEQRELTAEKVNISPLEGNGEKKIVATGSARWSTRGREVTSLSADILRATVAGGNSSLSLRHVRGEGHSAMEQMLAAGALRRSTADVIDITLRQTAKGNKQSSANMVEYAVEDGNVIVIDRRAPDAKTHAAATESKAYAQHAEYDGATKRAVLTGSPRLESPEISLSARRMTVSQANGDATAEGDVKGTAAGEKGREATHILAARAELHHADDLAIFYGVAGGDARLWQGSSQILAPRIEMERAKQQMRAYSIDGRSVRAVLPMRDASQSVAKQKMFAGVVRVTTSALVYSGSAAQPTAHLSGGVKMQQLAGSVSAQDVLVTFKTAAGKSSRTAMPAGEVETVRAKGDVHLTQPGRTGTGALLVYTAAKDEFELTGTPSAPPRIVDVERGSITGSSLIFHAADDSVIVAAVPGKRVHTETRVDR
ncbi:MAG: hypothetical protein JSS87_08930 [Acidobacteria bacterium]|nr:hypothetical protein [Acidobacteriota bacterium]